jgi:hypothetical protein
MSDLASVKGQERQENTHIEEKTKHKDAVEMKFIPKR